MAVENGNNERPGETQDGLTPFLPGQRRIPLSAIFLLLLVALLVGFSVSDGAGASWAGLGMLLLVPAAMGGLTADLVDPDGTQSMLGCYLYPTLFLIALSVIGYVVFGEGAICLAMALPLWVPAAMTGALVSHLNARLRRKHEARLQGRSYAAGWLLLPLVVIGYDAAYPPEWQDREVVREVIVDADPRTIWPMLVSVPAISPDEGKANLTQDILGVPRPSSARLVRRDGDLVRLARWGSDIRFEESITRIDAGRAITWHFAFPDDSVQAHTDRHISPDGATLKIDSGGYTLKPVGKNRVRLRRATSYRMRTRMPGYIGWWGDVLLGDVQENILAVVRDRAEARSAALAIRTPN
ncbi:hypothetical protein [Croceicoccus mobilis]|uniref:SRPBCC family protein n=1 Tax=Croceicoccus mobilis TaxID=1703339 RepID=A0A916Z6Z8_9SPHN|nr:hypothetical protein [Croceicoccus mobilis]GGD79748.1 hypothetical protein GCM10010990_32100 [Croceicoccus mobilis]